MAVKDDYRRGDGEDEEAAAEAEAPGAARRKRLAWIDWCRTQSVYNVVCGHAYVRGGPELPGPRRHRPAGSRA